MLIGFIYYFYFICLSVFAIFYGIYAPCIAGTLQKVHKNTNLLPNLGTKARKNAFNRVLLALQVRF